MIAQLSFLGRKEAKSERTRAEFGTAFGMGILFLFCSVAVCLFPDDGLDRTRETKSGLLVPALP
jgi:hypothetical protein